MKLAQHKKEYQEYTRLASASVRQLAFAGIAVIWIFKYQQSGVGIKIPKELILPLLCFGATLLFDLLQYISGYLIHYLIYIYYFTKLSDTESPGAEWVNDHPNWVNLIHAFMWCKISALFGGYAVLTYYIFTVWVENP